MGISGFQTLGNSGSEGRVYSTFRFPSSSFTYAYSPSELRSLFRSGVSSFLFSRRLAFQGCHRTGIPRTRLFVTLKVTGGWRPVIDLSRLSHFVQLSHFHMETAQSVLQSLRPSDWMISIDLQDAYLQVPVHQESRRYLRFCIGERTFQFRVLCFELSSAPHVFTRVMALVSSIMHRFEFRILRYLDDWLLFGSSLQEIKRVRDFLLGLCSELGIQVNLSKSSLTPSQTLDYLGMTLSSSPLRAFPTPARVSRAASQSVALPSRCDVISVVPHPWLSSPDASSPTPSPGRGSSVLGDRADLLGRLLPPRSSVVVCALPSRGRGRSLSSSPGAHAIYRRVRLRLGLFSRGRPAVRLVVSRGLDIFHQSPVACSVLSSAGFPPSAPRPRGVSFHRQDDGSFLPPQGRGDSVFPPQLSGPGCSSPLRNQRNASTPPVCPGPPQRFGRRPQQRLSSPGDGMDSFHGGLSGAIPTLAGHDGPFRYLSTIGSRSTSPRWWIPRLQASMRCSSLGIIFRLTPSHRSG